MINFNNTKYAGRRRQAAVLAVLIIIAFSWLNVIDRKAQEYVDEATVQALSIFGTLRLANAVISVIKTVEVDAVIASVQFGQMLDPVDDLIEDASSVLKMSIGSLIVQKILGEIVATSFFKLLLTLCGALLIVSLFLGEGRYSGFLIKVFALVGLARFLVVLVIFLNGIVDQAFVSERTSTEHNGLQAASASISSVSPQGAAPDDSDPAVIELKAQIQSLKDDREALQESIAISQAKVAEAQAEMDVSEAELETIRKDLGLRERYFSENPEYDKQKALVEQRASAVSSALYELDQLVGRLDIIDEKLEDLAQDLRGGGKGFFASAREMMDFSRLQDKAEQMVDSTLNLMALLTLKAVVIPVIFLVLLLKGFRYIWGIDARTLAVQQWQSAKDELNHKA